MALLGNYCVLVFCKYFLSNQLAHLCQKFFYYTDDYALVLHTLISKWVRSPILQMSVMSGS
jgi:hypothetical protein